MKIDTELKVISAITRSLPKIRGSGVLVNRLFKPMYCRKNRPSIWIDVHGFAMYLNPAECVDGELLFAPQLYDRREISYLKEHLGAGDTFVDAGANLGIYALLASRAVHDSGTVVAIEADPENFRRLAMNVEKNKITNIALCQTGISDKEETLSLKLNTAGNRGGNSFAASGGGTAVDVPCTPLLDILEQQGIERLKGIKLDIEGFEARVLRAFFRAAGSALHPDFVILEVNPCYSNLGSAVDILQDYRYRPVLDCGLNMIFERG